MKRVFASMGEGEVFVFWMCFMSNRNIFMFFMQFSIYIFG